jgi:acyl phosphate:glycerol-3-phosphate acyltransferase
MLFSILCVAAGYLLGSIPTSLLMSRFKKGTDIRRVGSNNMGAANVIRQIGLREGLIVGIADIAKGAAAVLIPKLLGLEEIWVMASGFGAVLGHNYPVFAGFRGGRGSASVIGIFLVLSPLAILISLVIIAIPVFRSRNFAFEISIGFALLPLFIFLFGYSISLVLYAVFIDLYLLLTNISQTKLEIKNHFWKK